MATTRRTFLTGLATGITRGARIVFVTNLPKEIFTQVTHDGVIGGLTQTGIHQAVPGADAGLAGRWVTLTQAGGASLTGLTTREAIGTRILFVTHLPKEVITQVPDGRAIARLTDTGIHQTIGGTR